MERGGNTDTPTLSNAAFTKSPRKQSLQLTADGKTPALRHKTQCLQYIKLTVEKVCTKKVIKVYPSLKVMT